MYAVIETGGKQYRVEVGTELEVELLDAEPGQTVTLDRVLLVADGDQASIGQPVVADAAVSAEVVRQKRGEKVIAFKYRPKARRRVKKGHRQELMVLRIADITVNGRSAAKAARKAADDAKTERERLAEAAAAQAAKDAELAAKLAVGAEGTPTKKPARGRAKPSEPAVTADAEPAVTADAEVAAELAEPEPSAEAAPASRRTRKPRTAKAEEPEATAETETAGAEETAAAETETAEPTAAAEPEAAAAEPDATAETETTDKPRRSRARKKDE